MDETDELVLPEGAARLKDEGEEELDEPLDRTGLAMEAAMEDKGEVLGLVTPFVCTRCCNDGDVGGRAASGFAGG